MPDLGKLTATVSLNTHGFENPLIKVRESLSRLRESLETIAGPLAVLGVSFAAFRSAEGFTEGLKGVFEMGKELKAQSAITGQSINELMVLGQAYKEAGMDAGSVTQTLVMLQKALGGVNDEGLPTKDIFKQLHLNMEQLKGMSAVQQFQAISKAIGGLRDQSSKTAAIMAIFGRSGAQMEALFSNPKAIEEAREALGGMGSVMQQNAAIFAKISNAFELLGDQSQRFFAGFGGEIAPALDDLLDKIKGIDLTKLGKQVGAVVATLSVAFKDGKFGELVGDSLTLGAFMFANRMNKVAHGIGGALAAAVSGLAASLAPLGDMFKGIGQILAAGAMNFIVEIQKTGAYLQAAFDVATQAVKNLTFTEAVKALENQWVQALLDPVRFLLPMLEDAALSFGKAMFNAIRGNTGAIEAMMKVTQAATNPVAAIQDVLGKTLQDTKGGKQKSYDDFVKDRLGESQGSRDALGADAKSELGAGVAGVKSSLATMRSQLSGVGDAITAAFSASYDHAGDILGLGVWKKRLDGVYDDLKSSVNKSIADALAKGGDSLGATKDPSDKVRARDFEADRLAKIGLFIGGTGGPAGDHARRTADNTGKISTKLDSFHQLFQQHMHATHMHKDALGAWQ